MGTRKSSAIPLAALLVLSASCGGDGRPGDATGRGGSAAARTYGTHRGIVELDAGADVPAAVGQTIYVPVYSSVYTHNTAKPFDLAITLCVRNTDRSRPIVVSSVRFYGVDGASVR